MANIDTLPQVQTPDYLGDITKVYENKTRQLQLQQYQEELAKAQRQQQIQQTSQQLGQLYSQGDPKAGQALLGINPDHYTAITNNLYEQSKRAASYASAINGAPKAQKAQVYAELIKMARNDPLINQRELAAFPDQYSPDQDAKLYSIAQSHRTLEDSLKAPQEAANLQSTKANTQSTIAQTSKTNQDIQNLIADRMAAEEAGLSPTAYKNYAQTLGTSQATAQTSLPKVVDQGNQALNLINDIISHPGMSDVVGAKNLFSGAASQYIPFVDKAIPGTDAADFMAKFEQLQGKEFLQAYETLKGGGSISEVEGIKATNAISSMKTAQSEKEFLKSANELKEIIKNGIRRAVSQAKNHQKNHPRSKRLTDKYGL